MRPAETVYALSYISYKTNRPSNLFFGPITQNPRGNNPNDWGGGNSLESCGTNTFSRQTDSICKVKVIGENGEITEYSLKVFDDSIDLPAK